MTICSGNQARLRNFNRIDCT